MTLFEQCCEAAGGVSGQVDNGALPDITRAVLTTILNHTGSPRTVEEIERILAEAE